ncbi:MAG: DegV family protein [Candidatus Dormibacteraeota bacterium]|uniref:DegV family protein n=1 Tax=Candidatus Aeolococcus gillhamiae TaxID=3127015 RepID=A0A934JW17_9BACT|nr:DegV family protein [Candidatus Dormibacteraeota bacterium]
MSSVHLAADSTCDLPPADAERIGLRIIPLKVIIGEEVFADGRDIDAATLYSRMRHSSVVPRTSQPTPAEFEVVFSELGGNGSAIFCSTISAAMSGTYSAAVQATEALPGLHVHVFDTRTVGPGHRMLVNAVVAAAAGGADAGELEQVAAEVAASMRLVFTVESLEYLRRGGRIGGARALLGSVLNIKPILEVRDGTVEPLDRVRTFPRALDRLVEEVGRSAAEWGGHARVMVAHADQREMGAEVARRAGEAAGEHAELIDVGPVIGCHGGPGAIGVAFHRPI